MIDPQPSSPSLTIHADRLVTSTDVFAPGWVRVRAGVVEAVGSGAQPGPEASADDGRGAAVRVAGTIVPGFVDIHCHGGGGASLTAAATDPAAVARVVATHAAHGTTTLVASLVSATAGILARQVSALAELAGDGVVAGIHLEGPWISPAHAGAHAPDALRHPSPAEVAGLLRAGDGHVRVVTLAPELTGGLDAVRTIVAAGAVAAIGHTDADAPTARAAIGAGARLLTHAFNAMRPLHHRDPGALGAALVDDRVAVELVLDGHHVSHEAAEIARRVVGDRLVLVSDAMAAAGAGDGDHHLGALAVQVRGGVARLAPPGQALGTVGSLAGSTLTMDAAFARLVTEHGVGLPQAVRATATGPAAVLGSASRGGDAPVGDLVPGARADLVVLDAHLAVSAVMRQGTWLGSPGPTG